MSTDFGNYYNVNEVEANAGYESLPAGEYAAIATEGAVIDTKDGLGKMVKFQFQVIEGQRAGAVVFTNYNIINKNEQAAAIGRGQLKHFATVLGKPHATDAAELLNIPFKFTYGKQKNSDYMEVKKIEPYVGAVSSGQTTVAQQQTKPSWMK